MISFEFLALSFELEEIPACAGMAILNGSQIGVWDLRFATRNWVCFFKWHLWDPATPFRVEGLNMGPRFASILFSFQ
jgi:hypothetical protein